MPENITDQIETGPNFNNLENFKQQESRANTTMMDEVNESRRNEPPVKNSDTKSNTGHLEFTPLY